MFKTKKRKNVFVRFTYNKTETGRCAFLLLSELLSGIDAQIFKGKDFDEKNGCVRGITVNSRAAKEGYIFAAINLFIGL